MPKEEIIETPVEELETPPEAEAAAPAPEAQAAEYTPNYKFKYTDDDGEKEAEFEEWARPLVNKDTEEKFREVFTKAMATEFLKNRRDKAHAERAEIENNFATFKNQVQEIYDLREKDIGLFLQRVGVDEKAIAQYLVHKAEAQEKLKDLPEPLRNLYNETQELRRQNLELQKMFETAQAGSFQNQVQSLETQTRQILATPEIAPIVADYEAKRGAPGSFFDAVKAEGELEFMRTQKTITPAEAVQRAIQRLALNPQAPSQGATPNAGAAPKVITQKKPVVIPNVGAGTAAPTSRKVKSIDDIKKLAKEMAADKYTSRVA